MEILIFSGPKTRKHFRCQVFDFTAQEKVSAKSYEWRHALLPKFQTRYPSSRQVSGGTCLGRLHGQRGRGPRLWLLPVTQGPGEGRGRERWATPGPKGRGRRVRMAARSPPIQVPPAAAGRKDVSDPHLFVSPLRRVMLSAVLCWGRTCCVGPGSTQLVRQQHRAWPVRRRGGADPLGSRHPAPEEERPALLLPVAHQPHLSLRRARGGLAPEHLF